jgi:hypothetical protein
MTKESYPQPEAESTARYVVFVRRNPARYIHGHAKSWTKARELGAKKLRVRAEDVWAVAVRDDESDADAVKREVAMLNREVVGNG